MGSIFSKFSLCHSFKDIYVVSRASSPYSCGSSEKKKKKGTKKIIQTQIAKKLITKSVVNNWDIKTTGPVANVLIKYLQIKRNYKCSKMLSVFYGIINALYDLINAIRFLSPGEEGKERT